MEQFDESGNIYSQNGEDWIIEKLLNGIGAELGLTRVWLTGSFSFLRPRLRPVLGFFQIRWV
jgi:hypothetical protein